ncbi:MAG: hypothetical protein H0X22_08785 [Acidimicrobiia bacterium]|nr:hypothetical protein [Acidimicrobiia bacterium]
MELAVACHPLVLVAALEAEVWASIAVLVSQAGSFGSCVVRVRAGRDIDEAKVGDFVEAIST